SGLVREYDISYRGDEVVVNTFKQFAFFPMSWAINQTPNKYFYKTETQTELHVVPTEVALEFIKANPDVMLDLLSRIYRGMDGLLGRTVHLMSGTAKSRLVYELIIACSRLVKPNPDGSYTLHMNEIDLPASSGLSRETISREIAKLKERDLVSVTGKIMIVKNILALKKMINIKT
ncbi:MAG: Crp/Fnr family transcriptional regulator, partial [Microcoleus sp.]